MEINEKQTKGLLGLIYDSYQRNNRITFSSIYNFLGNSSEEGTAYTLTPMIAGNLFTKMQKPVMQSNWKEMPEGLSGNFNDYFHKKLDVRIVPDYRLMLNIKTQQKTLEIAEALIKEPWEGVYSIKILATNMRLTEVKYDKMIIYYNSTRLTLDRLITYLNSKLAAGDLHSRISGFYQEVSPGVGVGKEVRGTSFTTERAYDVMEFLINCGGKYIHRGQVDCIYGALNAGVTYREDFISLLYNYVVRRIRQQEIGLL